MSETGPNLESLLSCSARPAPSAMVRTLPDGTAVVLDLETEKYFGLDGIAADMWSVLVSQPTIDSARRALLDRYDVDAARLDADLLEFVETLRSRGLLVVGELDEPAG